MAGEDFESIDVGHSETEFRAEFSPEVRTKMPVRTKASKVLESLRGRSPVDRTGRTPATVFDAYDLVAAQIEDNKAEKYEDRYEEWETDRDKTPTGKLLEINSIIEKMQLHKTLTDSEVSQVTKFFRNKRDRMDEMFEYSWGMNTAAEKSSHVYRAILTDIYEVVPYTAESHAPEYPGYAITNPERFLDPLEGKEKLDLSDAHAFFQAIGKDISKRLKAEMDDPLRAHWVEQREVMKAIDKYRDDHEEELRVNPPPKLRVTVEEGKTKIDFYKPKAGVPLKDELKSTDETREFIFDTDPGGLDMQYMKTIFALDDWNTQVNGAAEAIKLVSESGIPLEDSGEDVEEDSEEDDEEYINPIDLEDEDDYEDEEDKIEITSTQYDGIYHLINLFTKGIERGTVDAKYTNAIRKLERVVNRNIGGNPKIDILTLREMEARAKAEEDKAD